MPEGYKAVSEYSVDKVIESMNMFSGDVKATAKALQVSPKSLANAIYKNPRLKALFIVNVVDAEIEPDEAEQMCREADLPNLGSRGEDNEITKNLMVQNIDLLADGLERNGISKKTIDKIKGLGAIEKSAATFLVGSLDMMHRLVVYNGASLLEMAENIKDNYLDPSIPMSVKERLQWQRMYNQIVDQIGKNYDRVRSGTETMVKLTTPKSKDAPRKKPGFTPLKKADRDAR